jgi:hypothetical protein
MPVLYYSPDVSHHSHDLSNPDNPDNIYDYKDNHGLVELGMPRKPGLVHKLFKDLTAVPSEPEGKRFYWNTRDYRIPSPDRPCRADSFLLISAGYDGEYGTSDDICNFKWKYKKSLVP